MAPIRPPGKDAGLDARRGSLRSESQRHERRWGARETGAALLAVLMIVSVISTVAVIIAEDIRFALRRLNAMQTRDQAHWYALGAETFVKEVIVRSWELDQQRSTLNAPWAAGPATFPIDGGVIQGEIRDGSNCFNLNSVVAPGDQGRLIANKPGVDEFQTLINDLEVAPGEAEELSNALVDWIDTDNQRYGRGAEDVVYSLAKPPYRTANALIRDVLELRAISGFDEEVIQGLRPYVCAHPDPTPSVLNVNTLTPEQAPVLHAALAIGNEDVTRELAERLIESRPPEGFNDLQEFWDLEDLRGFSGLEADRGFRIGQQTTYFDVAARVTHHGAYVEVNAVLALDARGRVSVVQRRFGERQG